MCFKYFLISIRKIYEKPCLTFLIFFIHKAYFIVLSQIRNKNNQNFQMSINSSERAKVF